MTVTETDDILMHPARSFAEVIRGREDSYDLLIIA